MKSVARQSAPLNGKSSRNGHTPKKRTRPDYDNRIDGRADDALTREEAWAKLLAEDAAEDAAEEEAKKKQQVELPAVLTEFMTRNKAHDDEDDWDTSDDDDDDDDDDENPTPILSVGRNADHIPTPGRYVFGPALLAGKWRGKTVVIPEWLRWFMDGLKREQNKRYAAIRSSILLVAAEIAYWAEPAEDGTPRAGKDRRAQDQKGEWWVAVSVAEVAKKLVMSRKQVRTAIQHLKKLRFCRSTIYEGKYGPNTLWVLLDWRFVEQAVTTYMTPASSGADKRPRKPKKESKKTKERD